MFIFNLIGDIEEQSLVDIAHFLSQAKGKEVCVNISSSGGSLDVALAIVGMLKSYHGTVHTRVFGYCFSSAVLIFATGTTRKMSKYGWVMVHESSDKVKGNAGTVRNFAKNMDKQETAWNQHMQEFTGTDAKVWEKLSEKDTYLNADECVKLNLATEII